MKISSRTKKILNILTNHYDYITVKSIAEKLEVSSRTILRELNLVEEWLQENDYQLDKKKGTGIRLNCDNQEKANIKNLLKIETVEKYFTPAERRTIILTELLKKQEPTKLFNFTVLTNVSEATICHDLDEIENWIKAYNLKLVRKPGLGVYLKGEEKDIRQASINLLYENIDQQEIFRLIQAKFSDQSSLNRETIFQNRLLGLIGADTVNILESFVQEIEANIDYQLADDSYVALVVHLAIALQRIKNNEKITIDPNLLEQLKQTNEYVIATGLISSISRAFSVEIPVAEIGYVAMHLRGSKGRGAFYNSEVSMTEDYKLVNLSRKMVEAAELELGVYLEDDEKFLVGLVRHLEPTINRIKLGLEIRNPLLNKIKEYYADLFAASQKCAAIIENDENITVPEAEIAYLAMHLGAAVERKRGKPVSEYRVVVACTSGIGASRLLASRINKEFDNLKIIDLISTIDFDEGLLKTLNIDFIVSTVPIATNELPIIVVNPLLTEKHQQKIKNFLATHPVRQKKRSREDNKITLKEKLAIVNNYNKSILEILENLKLINGYNFKNPNQLILDVSKIIVKNSADQKILEHDLKNREKKGSTVLEHHHIMLLHCRSNAVKELNLLILHPEDSFEIVNKPDDKKKIRIVVVMVAPLASSPEKLEVMSEVSKLLIENERFIQAINFGNEEDVYYELDNYFDYFYQQKSKMKFQEEDY